MGLPKQRALAAIIAVFIAVLALFVVFRPGDQASAGIDLADPNAWIEHGLDGELLRISASSGEVTARIEVASPGDRFTAVPHGDGAAVLNYDTSSVSLVSGSLLRVTTEIPVALNGDVAERSPQIIGAFAVGDNVTVVDDDQLVRLDPQTRIESPISLRAPFLGITQDSEGRVLALTSAADEVLRMGDNGLDVLVSLTSPVDGTAAERSLVTAGGRNFVVDPARLTVWEVLSDGTVGIPFCTTSAASGAIIGGSGDLDEPSILAYNTDSSVLSISVPGGGCSEINVGIEGDNFGPPVASEGMVYLPNWGERRIAVIDIDQERLVANLPFGSRASEPFELNVVGSTVWANEPEGPFAAVINGTAIMPIAKIETIVAGNIEIDGDGKSNVLTPGGTEGSGLLVLGDTGAEAIAAEPTGETTGDGPGTGDGDTLDDILGDDTQTETIEPDAIGIAATGPPSVVDDTGDALVPEITETLIANFGVSSGTAIEGEVLRFTDFSTGSPTSWTWDFGDGTGAQEPNVEKSWDNEGVYLASLTVTNAQGDESVQSTEITIVPETVLIPPTADFVFDRNTIEEGERVSFESRAGGEADLLEWDFGDGESSIGATATHTFDTAGKYIVTLTASNPAGSTSASTTVTVLSGVKPPTAGIAALPTKIVNGQFVTLRSVSLNEPTRLSWEFGDGTRGSGESLRHVWDSPGTYRVRLTAENSAGSDSTFVDVVVAKRIDPPISQFTQSATEVLVGETVTFSNLSLNEPTRLIWDFGDNTTARGETAAKSWSQPGRYRVTLRATNDAGTNRTGVTITVIKPVEPPVASFTASALTIGTGQRVNFSDTSSNTPTSWSWTFGDTGSSNNSTTSHDWSSTGVYTVRLTATNAGGTSTAEKQVTVIDPPVANFRWVADGNTVTFTDTSRSDPRRWRWNFGDGTTSTERNPTHTFSGGKFEVTLVASNDAGSSAPKTETVTVGTPPVADIDCSADGPVLTCSGAGSTNAVGYSWRASKATTNSTPNQASTTFTFDKAGRFDITLLVANNAGQTDSITIRSPRVTAGVKPRITDVKVAAVEGDLVRLQAVFDRNPTSWEWEVEGAQLVEGGNTSSPLFRVPANGNYDGRVRATNQFGNDSESFEFEANPFTTSASFTWEIVEPGVVQFVSTSSATVDASFDWRFGGKVDVLDDDPQRPVVRYRNSGVFEVRLIVEDRNGRDVARRNVTVPPIEDPEDPDDR